MYLYSVQFQWFAEIVHLTMPYSFDHKIGNTHVYPHLYHMLTYFNTAAVDTAGALTTVYLLYTQ